MTHLLLLALLSQAPPGVRVEVEPAAAELEVGQALQLVARVLDAGGRPVPGAAVEWHVASDNGSVDATGLVTAGYRGSLRVTAVARIPGVAKPEIGEAVLHVRPLPAARIEVTPTPQRLVVNTRLFLAATAYSRQGDRRDDVVRFSSSNPRVVAVTPDGQLAAAAAGRATITMTAGPATRELPVEVLAASAARVVLTPAAPAVRTGDVVRFTAVVRD